jgi:peptidoglycan/LPS O-acetylase OafA/YrhL
VSSEAPPAGGYRRLGHLPALDGLRAIAVILVLIDHSPQVVATLSGELPKGFLGVDIFFVLSGFLITALLLKDDGDGGVRFGAFWRRRLLRLYPALVFMLACYTAYVVVTDLQVRNFVVSVISILFYFANWRIVRGGPTAFAPPGLGAMWSLSIEEQFYFVWPFVVAFFLGIRQKLSVIVAAIAVTTLAVIVLRIYLWEDGWNYLRIHVMTITRVDSLLAGALVAHLWVRRRTPTKHTLGPAIAATLVFCWCLRLPMTDSFYFYGGYTVVAICVAVVLLTLLNDTWFAVPFKWGPLRAVGKVSYGLYLWHFPVFYAVSRYLGPNIKTFDKGIEPVPRLLVAYTLTVAFTLLSWFAVERPFLRWKDRLEARDRERRAAAAAQPPDLVATPAD